MKMRKQKKGFTITELVIVIAVIAVLAAVLIPTFVSLVRRANESKDIQLVHNLNTALTIDGEEHHTMQDALDAALESGYDVDKINASATGNEILWDKINDQFCYLKKDGNTKTIEYIPDSKREYEAKGADFWQICDSMPDTQEYSIYAGNKWTGPTAITNLTVGFDVGTNDDITSIEYIRTAADATAQTVTIRTNSTATTLTINAPLDTVYHFGDVGYVNVIAVDKFNSYHEFGEVSGTLDVENGHVVVEANAKVEKINVSATAADAFSVEDKSNTVAMVTADTPSVLTETNVKVHESAAVMTSENANAVAYSANSGFIANSTDLKNALTGKNTITILKDVEWVACTKSEADMSVVIDLNKHSINYTAGAMTALTLQDGASIEFKNGKLDFKTSGASNAAIMINSASGIKLDGVEYNTNGVALYPRGDAAMVEINNSHITAPNAYAVSTNASGTMNFNVNINITNSKLEGKSPVLVNVPCVLNIKNCNITGGMHGVVVRGGTANIEDCNIKMTEPDPGVANYFDTRDWGQGNMINLAALVIGNKSTSYQYASNVTVKNTSLEVVNTATAYPALYIYGNSGEGIGASLNYENMTVIAGDIKVGNKYCIVNGVNYRNSSETTFPVIVK